MPEAYGTRYQYNLTTQRLRHAERPVETAGPSALGAEIHAQPAHARREHHGGPAEECILRRTCSENNLTLDNLKSNLPEMPAVILLRFAKPVTKQWQDVGAV